MPADPKEVKRVRRLQPDVLRDAKLTTPCQQSLAKSKATAKSHASGARRVRYQQMYEKYNTSRPVQHRSIATNGSRNQWAAADEAREGQTTRVRRPGHARPRVASRRRY